LKNSFEARGIPTLAAEAAWGWRFVGRLSGCTAERSQERIGKVAALNSRFVCRFRKKRRKFHWTNRALDEAQL
jgi:hypothetical protein